MIDATKLNMLVPRFAIDNIIGIKSGTFTVNAATAGTGVTTNSVTIPTTFTRNCYFQGIFSFDNGATWNDFGSDIINLATPGFPVFQTCECTAYMQSSNLVIAGSSYYNYATSTGTTYTILYKVALFARNVQGSVKPEPTLEKLQYISSRNYQKIYLKGTAPYNLVSLSGQSATINHGLGYIPKVRAFFVETSGGVRVLPTNWRWAADTLVQLYISTQITENDVTFYTDPDLNGTTVNGQIEYRIYLDS